MVLTQAARDLDNLFHRVIGAFDDARREEQPLDIIAFVEIEREVDDFLRRETRTADVGAFAVDAIMAVENAAIGQQYLQQLYASAICRIGMSNAHALGGTDPARFAA